MPTIPTIEERVAENEKDIAALKSIIQGAIAALKSSRFDWSSLSAYLPAVRSLVWAAAGMVAGGGGAYLAVPPTVEKVPGPERVIERHKETVREVPVKVEPKDDPKSVSKPGKE